MENSHPTPRRHSGLSLLPSASGGTEHDDLGTVIIENAQLKELVIQLSKIAIKNVIDRK
jgi:hypothetical protein